jgi:hypothetical protein
VEEPVCQRIDFQPGDGVHRVAADVTHHVMPLKDMVKHNAVNEAAQTQAEEQPEHLQRRLPNRSR